MPTKLPTVRFRRAAYTVDERLREFRRVEYGKRIAFIPFDSPQGQRLLRAMVALRNRAAQRSER